MNELPDTVPESVTIPEALPLLPVRDIVVFPYMVLPLFVGRPRSVAAVEAALEDNRLILLATQKLIEVEEPDPEDVFTMGTVAQVMRMLKLPDGRIKILVQGVGKARITSFTGSGEYFRVAVEPVSDQAPDIEGVELQALIRTATEQMERLVGYGKSMAPDILVLLEKIDEPGRLADMIVSNLGLRAEIAQEVLENLDPVDRLKRVNGVLATELSVLEVQHQIQTDAKSEIDKSQREYILREQMKSIKRELGEEDRDAETRELLTAIENAHMPDKVEKEVRKQLARLERMHPDSSEASITRTYLDWITELPWAVSTQDVLDLEQARLVLDEDHYGLEKIKERILEYLAVCKLKGEMKGPILCFFGPPGVGKTSLGRSIARAVGRNFVRVALGGMRDEAEIRGHRRTYVGAMPGRIVQSLKQAGSYNPVFMLDEIDKLGSDFRGDPASALLEVLDPEQNASFTDHYLGVPFDLSRVMFITTCNQLDTIPGPLRDRMEIISLSSYMVTEKVQIARRYLLPKQMGEHGIGDAHIHLSDRTLEHMVTRYTREAGVRNLEREVANVCRKVARRVAEGRDTLYRITPANLHRYLGVPRFLDDVEGARDSEPGSATGLAWTPVGGDLIRIEATLVKGKGQLILTGQLGDVMKESAQAAFTCVRSRQAALGIHDDLISGYDLHIHVPAGAIPKDGPSAGVTMASAIASIYSGESLRPEVAMTGEVTLRGHVLPVGGIKEKVLAARRAGLATVILPLQNRKDLDELPREVRGSLRFAFAETLDQVFAEAFASPPGGSPGPHRPGETPRSPAPQMMV
ncbi:MAG: endopeptidase La [Nitrospirota bacterium]|nr:endopeptidase La [Nitrospirota bacterium]